MKDLLFEFEKRKPEIVFEWNDTESEATGWLVVNSIRNGSAGGGTRMRKGLDKFEVESLAKTMEIKFTVSGPPIGGAKSGINFDPKDPRKTAVLKRWFKAIMPLLKDFYGTGGDLNVDEIHDVIPITSEMGLLHPQEGTAVGHFGREDPAKTQRIERLKKGVSLPIQTSEYAPEGKGRYCISDMITGFGVAMATLHFYKQTGQDINGKRVLLQGFGNVGAAAGFFLAEAGAVIKAIIDREGGLISDQGFTFDQIKKLMLNRSAGLLVDPELIPFAEVNKKFWDIEADIFIPAAASRLVTYEQVNRMINAGLNLIACGANVPFADKEIFMGPIASYTDSRISLIPDFIANCGMARTFSYLMSNSAKLEEKAIFTDVSACIEKAVKEILTEVNQPIHLTRNGLKVALNKLNTRSTPHEQFIS